MGWEGGGGGEGGRIANICRPLTSPQRVEVQLLGDGCSVHGVWQILLVGENQQHRVSQLLLHIDNTFKLKQAQVTGASLQFLYWERGIRTVMAAVYNLCASADQRFWLQLYVRHDGLYDLP